MTNTTLETKVINLYCTYRLRGQIAELKISKYYDNPENYDENDNLKEDALKSLDKVERHQREMFDATSELLNNILIDINPDTVIAGIEAWNEADKENYGGTSADVLREVDVPEIIWEKKISTKTFESR